MSFLHLALNSITFILRLIGFVNYKVVAVVPGITLAWKYPQEEKNHLLLVSLAMKKPSHKLFDRLALRFHWPELDHRLFLNQSLLRERVPMTSTLDQRFSECGPQIPSGSQDTLRGSAKSQKYFHNTINMFLHFLLW